MSLNALSGSSTPATATTTAAAPAAAASSAAAVNWGLVGSDTPVGAVAVAAPAKTVDASPAAPAAATTTTTASSTEGVAAITSGVAGMEVKTAVVPQDEEDPTIQIKNVGLRKDAGLDAKVEVIAAYAGVYRSATSFDDLKLKPELHHGVMAMGFSAPSKIQAEALPIIMSATKPNFIGQAHAGSGKTAAYSLAMLTVVDDTKQFCQAMCVCPTRELARQVAEVVERLGKFTKVKVLQAISGGERGKVTAQIVVGTPGSLQNKLKFRDIDKNTVHMLVVDEADQMIDQSGFQEETVNLKRSINPRAQILLFSATFPERVVKFSEAVAPKAVWIKVKTEELSLDNIHQFYMSAPNEAAKFDMLVNLYSCMTVGQSIIFVHTVKTAKYLAKRMRDLGLVVALLHGKDMEPAERDRVMDDFRRGTATTLISTNVLARGIDVLEVTLVVNYDLPLTKDNTPDFETYIHRIGRTGRFGKPGCAINFIFNDVSRRQLGAIAQNFNKMIDELPSGESNIPAVEKKIKDALNKPLTVPLATTAGAPGGPAVPAPKRA